MARPSEQGEERCFFEKNNQTSGGPPLKTSIYRDIIVDVFGEDSPAFTGLVGVKSGGMDQPLEERVSPEMFVVHNLTSDEISNVTVNYEGVYFT